MIFYMSVSQPDCDYIEKVTPCKQLNILCSFEYRNGIGSRTARDFKNFMADSGAFTAMNAGKKIDDAYIDNYIHWIKEKGVKNYVEMDLDEIIGVEQTELLRKRIEKEVGYPSIPVWHLERGHDGFVEMCKQYDYVAISLSGMTKASKWLIKHDYKPLNTIMKIANSTNTKVHALGCNSLNLFQKYHFYSADC